MSPVERVHGRFQFLTPLSCAKKKSYFPVFIDIPDLWEKTPCPKKLSSPFAIYRSMAMNHTGLLVLLLIVAGLVMVSGCTSTPPVSVSPTPTSPLPTTATTSVTTSPEPQACTTYDDCVPRECCHPTSCINRANKGVCTLLCTAVCQGPIDCGAGSCGCVNGTCSVVSTGTSLTPTKYMMP